MDYWHSEKLLASELTPLSDDKKSILQLWLLRLGTLCCLWLTERKVAPEQPSRMDDLQGYYYKLSVTLLSGIGLWPGESTILRRIHKAGCCCIVIFSVIVQLLPFVTMQYTTTLLLTNVPTAIVSTGSLLKYFTFVLQSNNVKRIAELIKQDWSTAKNDEEIKIIMRHAGIGKFHATAFAKLFYVALIVFLLSQYTAWLMDYVAPINETRSIELFMKVEIFVDQERYFYILAMAFNVVCFATVTVYVATETVHLMWLEHQSSQFETYALNVYMNKFWWSYMILIGISVASLSMTLYRLSIALDTLDNLEELVMCMILITPVIGYMYYWNYMYQRVLDSYSNVCAAAYDTNWYTAPLRKQKMLLFVMLRNAQTLNDKWCGMYYPSMEGFMILVKMAFSYFVVMHSMR